MTKEAFLQLPAAVAIRVLFDCLDEDTVKAIGNAEAPAAPRSPKYDQAIYRKEGVMYASETDLSGLLFWHARAVTSAASGGQYADKDKKNAESLARWIAWREWYPDAVWSGERNREAVVAKAPSAKPIVYPRTGNGSRGSAPAGPATYPDADYGGGGDDSIPF